MKFSHFAELTTVNKPKDEFYLEITYVFSFQDYTSFASKINTEFEIIFLNSLFS